MGEKHSKNMGLRGAVETLFEVSVPVRARHSHLSYRVCSDQRDGTFGESRWRAAVVDAPSILRWRQHVEPIL